MVLETQATGRPRVVLLFSGGRDSTLAALRLANAGHPLTLVTITAAHLSGIVAVKRRLTELAPLLPGQTEWLQIVQPQLPSAATYFHHKTCLPCQCAYVVVGAVAARERGTRHVALGYAGYQSDWPEQAPVATAKLASVLHEQGLELLLPVYDLESRAAAIAELKKWGVSDLSLEQKCTQQVHNVRLDDQTLHEQVQLWGAAIKGELEAAAPRLEVSLRMSLAQVGS